MYKIYEIIEVILLFSLHMLVGQDKAALSHGRSEVIQLFPCFSAIVPVIGMMI
jgi:hypothetical protein